jgi:hypothetical protein
MFGISLSESAFDELVSKRFRIATMQITVPRGRKPAIVLAAVNGEALSGRLGDHP